MFSTEYLTHCCQRSEHYVQISVTMCFYISLLLSNSNSLPLHWKHILTIPISCNCRTLVLWLNFCFMVNLSLTTNFSANSDLSTHLRIPNSVLVMVLSMWSLKWFIIQIDQSTINWRKKKMFFQLFKEGYICLRISHSKFWMAEEKGNMKIFSLKTSAIIHFC